MRESYRHQVILVLQALPFVAKEKNFALKGGTAINFFIRDFPRLSVDIDLTYLPVKDRSESLKDIKDGVERIAAELEKQITGSTVVPQMSGGTVSKLLIRSPEAQIKLEVNTVLRGSIFYPVEKELSMKLQEEFELYVTVQSLSMGDLYGGKLCAALDRQHPRDLFDVWVLLNNEGITDKIRTAFIGYLISHSRPMNELLNPNIIPIEEIYHNEFEGMIEGTDVLDKLLVVQKELPQIILDQLTGREKEFLISFKSRKPKWELISIPHLKELSGVKWKLQNLGVMDDKKHKETLKKLIDVLDG